MKQRLDKLMLERGMAATRSAAENWIRLGKVRVNKKVVQKPGQFVAADALITLDAPEQYVSRAGLKLASVAAALEVDFQGKIVLDVGSSTGGFTDYALKHGAQKVFAVDVGTDQLHPSLRQNTKVELHEKTDIREFTPSAVPDVVVIDVSFISLRQILPHIFKIVNSKTQVIAMVKPQFEAGKGQLGSSGVIKNDTVRRRILKDFESWAKQSCVIVKKADSMVSGARGNVERFYLLKKLHN